MCTIPCDLIATSKSNVFIQILPQLRGYPTFRSYCIIFYLVMAEGTLTYWQSMNAYLLLFKFLEERLVNKCNIYVVLSCI